MVQLKLHKNRFLGSQILVIETLKAHFHSVQFIERAKFCDRFFFKCGQSAISNGIRSTVFVLL